MIPFESSLPFEVHMNYFFLVISFQNLILYQESYLKFCLELLTALGGDNTLTCEFRLYNSLFLNMKLLTPNEDILTLLSYFCNGVFSHKYEERCLYLCFFLALIQKMIFFSKFSIKAC